MIFPQVQKWFVLAAGLLLITWLAGCGGKKAADLNTALQSDNADLVQTYVLQPGDNIDIKFFNNPELNENVTIRPDGIITLQLVDEVQASGLTPMQLDRSLTEKYGAHLQQAMISVIMKSFAGQRMYVGGEVHAPSEIHPVGMINALQAIVNAGGFKDDADLENIVIVSRGADKRPLAKIVDLKKALKGEVPESAYTLRPYDIVYVPKTRLAATDQFMSHIYNLIPPRVALGFSYELHSDEQRTGSSKAQTNQVSFDATP